MSILAGKKSMFKRLCLGLDGEKIGQLLALPLYREQHLVPAMIACDGDLASDIPSVDLPGGRSRGERIQLPVDGAESLAGQQLPLPQQGVEGADGVAGGGGADHTLFRVGDRKGNLGQTVILFGKMKTRCLQAIQMKDHRIDGALMPVSVGAQRVIGDVRRTGVDPQVVVIVGKFLGSQRALMPGGAATRIPSRVRTVMAAPQPK